MSGEAAASVGSIGLPRRPAFGLTAKVLAPMTLLTLLSAALGGLILKEEYKSYQTHLAQKKGELAWQVRTLYKGNRTKLLDVANLLANNADVQNGLLIGDQYNALNTIMSFLGHSGIDIINVYDLDGRAFARAQSPSYFGDYDEFEPLVRSIVAQQQDMRMPTAIAGVATYQGNPALVAMRMARGVSGATGIVVVGQSFTRPFLEAFVPTTHTAIALSQKGRVLELTDVGPGRRMTDSLSVYEEAALVGTVPFEVNLLTDDPALFGPFWGARVSIVALAGAAGIGSVVVTFIFMFMSVVRPVRHLISVAEQQVSGDLSARTRLDSRDELGRLGDIFNVLTSSLSATLDAQERIIAERGRAYDSLKKGEAQLQAIITGVPCPLAITRCSDGAVIFANARFEEALELTTSEVAGHPIGQHFVDPQEYAAMLRSVREKGHVFNFETKLRTRSGDTMLALFSMRRMGTEEGSEVLNAFFDITERKRAEDEVRRLNEQLEARVEQRTRELQFELNERTRAQAALVRAKEEAEAANASKSRFLAAASHDLRQPVHAMTLFMSNLAQQVDAPKARHTVANVNACVESLCEMFEKILDVSKLASGVIEPQIQDFPIDRLMGRLLREFEGLAAEKRIDLNCVKSSLVLKSDPALLYRILSNLLSNALKNTKEGRVLLGCRRRSHGAEIQIWDTGVGIPEPEIKHIFEEFYRGANRQEQRGRLGVGAGLGLGLSIVEHTASLLKHTVHVSSTPGKHTMFSVEIPLGAGTSTSLLQPDISDEILDIAGFPILVVDDHVLALSAMQSTLEGWGCEVIAANSSTEAMEILRCNTPPQVLIVDYLLQNGDTGLNLLARVENELGIAVPAIVLSGVSSRLLEREVEKSGYRLLYKPAPPIRLRQMIIECLSDLGKRDTVGSSVNRSSVTGSTLHADAAPILDAD